MGFPGSRCLQRTRPPSKVVVAKGRVTSRVLGVVLSGKEASGPCQMLGPLLCLSSCPAPSPSCGCGGSREARVIGYSGSGARCVEDSWQRAESVTGRILSTTLHGVGQPAGLRIREFLQELFFNKSKLEKPRSYYCCRPTALLPCHCPSGFDQKAQRWPSA